MDDNTVVWCCLALYCNINDNQSVIVTASRYVEVCYTLNENDAAFLAFLAQKSQLC